MLRITSIHRKIEFDKGGIPTDEACNVILVVGNEPTNKARFLLTPAEAEALDAFTRDVEKRIGTLLIADYVEPEPEPEPIGEQAGKQAGSA